MDNGHVEVIKPGERGYGRFKYRVMGRNGYPVHHTDSRKEAEQYLKKCQEYWKDHPAAGERG